MIKEEINKFFGGIFMKMSKVLTTVLTATAALVLLSACSSDKKTDSSSSSKETANSSTEVVSGASISAKPEELEMALSDKVNWIVAATDNVTFDNEVTVAGTFHDKGKDSNDVYRKLALYSQDDNKKVTAEYEITVPKLIVSSENFNIVHGTVKGDIEVKANGFTLNGTKVNGNITFDKQEYKDSADLEKDGATVTGEVTVANN